MCCFARAAIQSDFLCRGVRYVVRVIRAYVAWVSHGKRPERGFAGGDEVEVARHRCREPVAAFARQGGIVNECGLRGGHVSEGEGGGGCLSCARNK